MVHFLHHRFTHTHFQWLFVLLGFLGLPSTTEAQNTGGRKITANIVALDQPFFYNRLGAQQPTGSIFALARDVVTIDGTANFKAGNVKLRDSKRPRPITVRLNKGDTLVVNFTNLLTDYDPKANFNLNYIDRDTSIAAKDVNDSLLVAKKVMARTRTAAFHPAGLNLLGSIDSDGSWVGANNNSEANPGGVLPNVQRTYMFYGAEEGSFLITPGADNMGMGGLGNDQLSTGLFGAVVVEPAGAEYYRSQVTNEDLAMATTAWLNANGQPVAPDKGLPIINWNATYPSGFWDPSRRNLPILNMLQRGRQANQFELICTDLTAVITGPNQGNFQYSSYPPSPDNFKVPSEPNREQPFREFVIIYHESPFTVQAFPAFYDPAKTKTLAAGDDAFSINYGSGGIGAEIYANRIGVGPMGSCIECAYEEFFLTSWAVGDPAMVVDVPANIGTKGISPLYPKQELNPKHFDVSGNVMATLVSQLETAISPTGLVPKGSPVEMPQAYKATKALYPDDPSNVYHSYLRDHVKFRVLHGGGAVTHVHHQHAHQWLHSPDSDDGHYLDSQVLNPGEAYTLEMVYNGSGNRNQTVGDQIFHCHFYPHFAAGMWAMWRVHDVFEAGTKYTSVQNLTMAPGARALPDAEITSGTPIPGLVPIPTLGMAPVPGAVTINNNGQVVVLDTMLNPGYPFFIPGIAGSRPPHPPLDFAQDMVNGKLTTLDGGLPRHVIDGGTIKWETHTNTDFTKMMDEAIAIQLPEKGTQVEKVAMNAHAKRNHPTITPKGATSVFIYNGLPPAPGAPFADPAIDDNGNPVGKKRIYKAANIQMDVVFNKEGWHYPQQRFITLWGDVNATLNGIRPPEPFFFRANTDEFVEYWHTNLVPDYYELDDYQVRTPTDILGQHIHLVKFDVTASDGAANGYNYEDGTFSPGAVQERIHAINKAITSGKGYYLYNPTAIGAINELKNYQKSSTQLTPMPPNPIWGDPNAHPEWFGAQTTIQRWYADPQLNNEGEDLTVRTVFTHDHFGPSTHQQAGLYAGLLAEPENATWIDPVTGDVMGQLDPVTRQPKPRTVVVDGKQVTVQDGGPTGYQANIILSNPEDSYREFALEFQDVVLGYTAQSRSTVNPYPVVPDNAFSNPAFQTALKSYTGWSDYPNSILAKSGTTGGAVPLVSGGGTGILSMNYRNEPLPLRVSAKNGAIVSGTPGDMSFAYSSQITRANAQFNSQPVGGTPINPSDPKSAKYPLLPIAAAMNGGDPYTPLLRAYQGDKIQVRTLVGAHMFPHTFNMHGIKWNFEPGNEVSGFRSTQQMGISEHFEMLFQLPTNGQSSTDYLYMPSADYNGQTWGVWGLMRAYGTQTRQESLVALPYNDPTKTPLPNIQTCGCPANAPIKMDTVAAVMSSVALKNISGGLLVYNQRESIADSFGLFLTRNRNLNADGTLIPGTPVEPLVLRYNAGDCIKLTLVNKFDPNNSTFKAAQGTSITAGAKAGAITYNFNTSATIGLSATLLSADVETNDGYNVGQNPVQTAGPGQSVTYTWYAGQWERSADGRQSTAIPVEFGSVVLAPSDMLGQPQHGMEGAIVIEPKGYSWVEDANSRASATVYDNYGNVAFRDFVLIYNDNPSTGGNLANYGSEPMKARYNTSNSSWQINLTQAFSNSLVGEPVTPIFAVQKGTPTRLHLPTAAGIGNGAVFELHGHVWQEEPYMAASTVLGYNPSSEWKGSQGQVAPLNAFDVLVAKAGGIASVPGDYLYRSLANSSTFNGFWGFLRVTDGADVPTISTIQPPANGGSSWTVSGDNTVNFAMNNANSKLNRFSSSVALFAEANLQTPIQTTQVNPVTGAWTFTNLNLTKGGNYRVVSMTGTTMFGSRSFTATSYGEGPVSGAKQPVVMALAAKPKAKTKSKTKVVVPVVDPRAERQEGLLKPGN